MVKIGIMSDSHDNIQAIKKAVKIFNDENVAQVFHAGDVISPFIAFLALKDLKCEFHCVFGNNDGEKLGLIKQFENIGQHVEGDFYKATLANKKIIMFHTLDDEMIEALATKFNVIIRGHDHQARVKKMGDCILVNPGETCGYLTGKATVAILDLEKLEARIVEL
ncbi:MAG: metallophosphoesterase [Candidatus Helarchaeota archaeon]